MRNELQNYEEEIQKLNDQIDSLNNLNATLREVAAAKENELEKIRSSISWKLTAPFRYMGNVCYSLMQKTYFTQCLLKDQEKYVMPVPDLLIEPKIQMMQD